jgi:hypothetical protein
MELAGARKPCHARDGVSVLRRIRGALVLASGWAVVWMVVGIGVQLLGPFLRAGRFAAALIEVTAWTITGFVSGALFSGVLAIAERRRTIAQLSAPRIALWGAVGGSLVPGVLSVLAISSTGIGLTPRAYPMFLGMVGLGAICGTTMLGLSRREHEGTSHDAEAAASR